MQGQTTSYNTKLGTDNIILAAYHLICASKKYILRSIFILTHGLLKTQISARCFVVLADATLGPLRQFSAECQYTGSQQCVNVV